MASIGGALCLRRDLPTRDAWRPPAGPCWKRGLQGVGAAAPAVATRYRIRGVRERWLRSCGVPRAAPSAPALPWGGSPWAVAAFVFALSPAPGPDRVFAARIAIGRRRTGVVLGGHAVAAARCGSCSRRSVARRVSVEVRPPAPLHGAQRISVGVATSWRRLTPAGDRLQEWEAGLQRGGGRRASRKTWSRGLKAKGVASSVEARRPATRGRGVARVSFAAALR